MTRTILAVSLLLAACSEKPAFAAAPRATQVQRDLSDYAMASCFAVQQNPYLKDQGERWAGAVMQRAHGPVEQWTSVADAVAAELKRTGNVQATGDGPQAPATPLPVMTCGQIIGAPSVQAALDSAAKALAADYAGQPEG